MSHVLFVHYIYIQQWLTTLGSHSLILLAGTIVLNDLLFTIQVFIQSACTYHLFPVVQTAAAEYSSSACGQLLILIPAILDIAADADDHLKVKV